ncbi:sulfite exporter TauE/SafE family protein [Tengunoibacter tsumagoiensis]|uniref:Probable membrane transporter protein n=1 Tax=Tengunoibacter tsumagoiensis TaxID=2014871 RepID=A0A401ZV25_9CHLR|nr:sulfite exporter TauE/SafE family protein [Tengunoibacter tsumagoiensis]GCE10574.1 UPF0721 transmembrane protein [Tengunoibacter tsumagoiensis]
MTFLQMIFLFLTAVIAGTLNSVAGGGSFFTFPALAATGVPTILANTTNTVALWPGSVASMGAYRREIAAQKRSTLILMVTTSLIGGVFGALLLIKSSPKAFDLVLPFLLLIATLLFTFNAPITTYIRSRTTHKGKLSIQALVGVVCIQLIIAIYGGYFGGGIGILILATLAIMGMEDIHFMNGLKTLLASCINGVGVITFILAKDVLWPQAIVMIVGAIIGGYGGAYYARKIKQRWIRLFVMIVGFSLTMIFFVKAYLL